MVAGLLGTMKAPAQLSGRRGSGEEHGVNWSGSSRTKWKEGWGKSEEGSANANWGEGHHLPGSGEGRRGGGAKGEEVFRGRKERCAQKSGGSGQFPPQLVEEVGEGVN